MLSDRDVPEVQDREFHESFHQVSNRTEVEVFDLLSKLLNGLLDGSEAWDAERILCMNRPADIL